jgi:hypothetical protein
MHDKPKNTELKSHAGPSFKSEDISRGQQALNSPNNQAYFEKDSISPLIKNNDNDHELIKIVDENGRKKDYTDYNKNIIIIDQPGLLEN